MSTGKFLSFLLLILYSFYSKAQSIGIGNTNPHSSSVLDISSSSKGVLIPRLTQSQRIAISGPATGLLVYQSDIDSSFFWYSGIEWIKLLSTSTGWTLSGNANTNDNSFIGTTDDHNIVFKRNNIRAGYIDISNTSLGLGALSANSTGNSNTAFGTQSLAANTSGIFNTAEGHSSLYANQAGSFNTAIGYGAMMANISGIVNTANGFTALANNTSGNYNVAIGGEVLVSNTTGKNNTGIGYRALILNSVGNGSVAIGDSALYSNTNGVQNTAIGKKTGFSNLSGSNNTLIGFNANVGFDGLINATAIGANAIVNTSNSLVLGNNAKVGIGTSAPLEKLQVVGNTRTDGFIMPTGAGLGKLFISDAQGNASWEILSKIQRLSIPAASFTTMEFNESVQIETEGEVFGTSRATLIAPVHLPDAAVITNVFFSVFDGDNTKQLVGKLYAYQNGSSVVTELASGQTSVAFAGGYTSFNIGINHTVNNALNSYAIQAISYNGSQTFWSGLKIESVIITYTYTIN